MPDWHDKWTQREQVPPGPFPPIDSAALDCRLEPDQLRQLALLGEALNAFEATPAEKDVPFTLLPYSFPKVQAQELHGHYSGLAVWDDYFNHMGCRAFVGVYRPVEPHAWYFVPAAAMPDADRKAVIAATEPESEWGAAS